MYSKAFGAGLLGLEAHIIQVEADVSNGLPLFHMVGDLSSAVREARERVRISLQNAGYRLPPKRITVNLSPADLRKEGSGYDLPIAISLLAAFGMIPQDKLKNTLMAGELSLNGHIAGVHGILAMADRGRKEGFDTFVVPTENAKEAALADGMTVIGVQTLEQVISYFKGEEIIEPAKSDYESWQLQGGEPDLDFNEVSGQAHVKRALEIAVSGGHNILMLGAPGTGKTMLAERLPGILPPLSKEEAVEITKIYSIAGLLKSAQAFVTKRPLRAPHHTTTPIALAGGGRSPMPGEITLAHKGVLFLDEILEFSPEALETLRQPLESGKISISRLGKSLEYPADVMLVAAMNPCKCGYFPNLDRCQCTLAQVKSYLARLSQPLLDRLDICVETERPDKIHWDDRGESSAEIRQRIIRTREIQRERYREESVTKNSQLRGHLMEKYCYLGKEERRLLNDFMETHYLSVRGKSRIIRVARTLPGNVPADLSAAQAVIL